MLFWELAESWIGSRIHYILPAMGAVLVLLAIVTMAALLQLLSLKKRYHTLMMGDKGLNLEELFNLHGELIEELLRKQRQTAAALVRFEDKMQITVGGVGLVRYNAFRETGSDLSFSLALLDRNLDGAVLTSLFGREESRCYGKPVQGGKSSYLLSDEEMLALREARRRMDAAEE